MIRACLPRQQAILFTRQIYLDPPAGRFANIAHRWCSECGRLVEPEGAVDVSGFFEVCPKCGAPLEEM